MRLKKTGCRSSVILLLTIMVSLLVVATFPQSTEAAVQGEWVNVATIKVGNDLYIDSKPMDETHDYYLSGNKNCSNEIDAFENNEVGAAKATITYRSKDPLTGDCKDSKDVINLGSRDAALIFFSWVDSATIEAVWSEGGIYKKLDGRNDFAHETNSECKSSIRPSGSEGKWTLRLPLDGCRESDSITVRITNLSASTLPPGSGSPTSGSGSVGNTGDEDDSCESKGSLSWIMCPVTNIISETLGWVDEQITKLLEVDSTAYEENGVKNAWQQIRNIAYIILVPIMLVMVIGTALGWSFIDAYTVKRALPRLLIAVLFMTLSWEITKFLIELSNVVGKGILGLITNPVNDGLGSLTLSELYGGSLWQGLFLPLVLGGALVAAWLFGGTLLLAAGIGFLVLMLRQMLIIALMIVAPLAILAWIFPGNDKLWKAWWSLFSKLLMMFPLILAIIGVGRVFAWLIHEGATGNAGLQGAIIQPIAVLLAWLLPYAFIPATFAFAGGVFATLTGAIQNGSKGLFARQAERRKEKIARIPQDQALKGRNALTRGLNRAMQYGYLAPKAGVTGLVRPRAAIGRIRSAAHENNLAALAEAEKNGAFSAISKDDDLLSAGLAGRNESDVRRELEHRGYRGRDLETSLAAVMRAQQALGNNFEAAAVVAKAGTGSGYSEVDENGDPIGHGLMLQDIMRAARGNREMERTLVAGTKARAQEARRFDISGAGFGANLTALERLRRGESVGDVTADLVDDSLRRQSAGAVLAGRGDSVQSFIPSIQRRIARAVNDIEAIAAGHPPQVPVIGPDGRQLVDANGTPQTRDLTIVEAQRILKQRLASTAGLLDAAGSVAPEAQEMLANGVMSLRITDPASGRTATVGQITETYRSDLEFQEMRREYQSRTEAEYTAALRSAAQPQQSGTAPPAIPGTPTI